MQRGEFTEELLSDPLAFTLLARIAMRARYSSGASLHGLTYGQALIGDWQQYGMTEKEYRGAKLRLERFRLVTFSASNKGTVATLCDSRVFSLKDERTGLEKGGHEGTHKGGQFSEEKAPIGAGSGAGTGTGKGRTEGGQRATNQNDKKGEMDIFGRSPAGGASGDQSVSTKQAPADAANTRRKQDPCFVALAEIEGSVVAELTAGGATTIAVALASIKRAQPDVTADEIASRARVYLRVMPPGSKITAHALAKHWARCAAARPPAVRSAASIAEPPFWREMVNETKPESAYARGGDQEHLPWNQIDLAVRSFLSAEYEQWSRNNAGRVVA